MKKLIAIIFIVVTLLSCKKQYTCSCNTTFYDQGAQTIFNAKQIPISKKLTKKQAQSVCDHEANNLDTLWYNYATNYGNSPLISGEKFYSSCALQ